VRGQPQRDGMSGVYGEHVDFAMSVGTKATQRWGRRLWTIAPSSVERLWTRSEACTGEPLLHVISLGP
jgi:hypothetical protein